MLSLDPQSLPCQHPSSLGVSLRTLLRQEWRSLVEEAQIYFGIHDTPLGKILIVTTPSGICQLDFLGNTPPETAVKSLALKWPRATLVRDQAITKSLGDRIFTQIGDRSSTPIMLLVTGTAFQIRVWQALLNVPRGTTTTYQAIAAAIDQPTAARAVGNAVGQNPISYLIPCHRVIRKTGALGGYHWGDEQKRRILSWEALPQGGEIQ
jgi:AraC family transcriptional regulator, regulatory protein of adaptative response / methylated-DNA-[protein]-cysteine methyltransferase